MNEKEELGLEYKELREKMKHSPADVEKLRELEMELF